MSRVAQHDDFCLYRNSILKYPKLSLQEELDLSRNYIEKGCLESMRKLVVSNLKYVAYYARRYYKYSSDIMDLIQEGNIALMKAAKKYDPSKGVRLVSFAVHNIKAAMSEYIIHRSKLIPMATTHDGYKIYRNKYKFITNDDNPSESEVQAMSKALNVKASDIHDTLAKMSNIRSLDNPDDQVGVDFQNVECHRSYQERLEAALENVTDCTKQLDPRMQYIISSRYLSECKESLTNLGTKYSISAERVRQLEAEAITKLQGLVTVNPFDRA